MEKRKLILLVLATIPVILLLVFSFKEKETKWGERRYTPNKDFYIEYTKVNTLRTFLPTTPGNGSDNVDGYIKLYSKSGKLLEAFFMEHLASSEVKIYDDMIISTRADSFCWELENYKQN